jgi:serine/threonine-protein kinase
MRGTTWIALLCLAACAGSDPNADDRNRHRDAAIDSPTEKPPDAAPPTDAPPAAPGVGPYFATPMFFNTDVSAAPPAANSQALISALDAEGGWGNGDVMQIDYALDVLTADNATPMRTFTTTSDFFTPDCDRVAMPVPPGGNLEGETGYACTTNGDCHLLVYRTDTQDLYEMWRADMEGNSFHGGCLAVWHGTKTYTRALRGLGCTSADAAGYPISPLLFTADEVAAGHIDHAIRFILPNSRPRRGFVAPATHGTSTTGTASAPYYGVHLRLRADYPVNALPTEGARVVARAMQKYGMYHADGGEIALTAQSDRHTVHKWAGLLDAHDLAALKVTDFEVIDHGAGTTMIDNCVRAP